MSLGGVCSNKGYDPHGLAVKEAPYVNLITIPLCKMSKVYLSGYVTVAAYHGGLSDIEGYGTTVGLQYDLAAFMYGLPDVSEPPSGDRVIADRPDILRAKPMTGGRHERSEDMGDLRVVLRAGDSVRARGQRAWDL